MKQIPTLHYVKGHQDCNTVYADLPLETQLKRASSNAHTQINDQGIPVYYPIHCNSISMAGLFVSILINNFQK
jgi:hypothetical protein